MKNDLNTVQELIEILTQEGLTSLKLEDDDFKVKIKRPNIKQRVKAPQAKVVSAPKVEVESTSIVEVVSETVGKFYYIDRDENPMVKIGTIVKKGQTIGEIRALGVSTKVVAPVEGKLKEILLSNGEISDFGKTIAKIELLETGNKMLENVPSGKPSLIEVVSETVGKFYYIDKDEKPMIKVGDTVKKGQIIGEVKALGVSTKIVSPVSGKVKSILLNNGEVSDYGRVIAEIEG